MKRLFALVLCLSAAHFGNAAPGGPKDQPVLLDVQPAAAPVPALKYQLLPEVAEMNPGNAVPARGSNVRPLRAARLKTGA